MSIFNDAKIGSTLALAPFGVAAGAMVSPVTTVIAHADTTGDNTQDAGTGNSGESYDASTNQQDTTGTTLDVNPKDESDYSQPAPDSQDQDLNKAGGNDQFTGVTDWSSATGTNNNAPGDNSANVSGDTSVDKYNVGNTDDKKATSFDPSKDNDASDSKDSGKTNQDGSKGSANQNGTSADGTGSTGASTTGDNADTGSFAGGTGASGTPTGSFGGESTVSALPQTGNAVAESKKLSWAGAGVLGSTLVAMGAQAVTRFRAF